MRRAQRGIPSKVHGLEFRWLYHDNLTKEPEDFRLLDIPRIGRTLCVFTEALIACSAGLPFGFLRECHAFTGAYACMR